MKEYYCENCFKENLKTYVKDHLGSIFCTKNCAYESLKHREIKKLELETIRG